MHTRKQIKELKKKPYKKLSAKDKRAKTNDVANRSKLQGAVIRTATFYSGVASHTARAYPDIFHRAWHAIKHAK